MMPKTQTRIVATMNMVRDFKFFFMGVQSLLMINLLYFLTSPPTRLETELRET